MRQGSWSSMLLCGLLALAPLLLAGCGRSERAIAPGPEPGGGPLLIGLMPEKNIFAQIDRFELLANYLASSTGRPVQLRILSRYGNIIRNFESDNLDGAFFGSFTYVLARRKLNVEVLARPERPDGTSTYHGLLIARKDSGIRSVQDLRGKVFAFVDKATMAGYLFPLALLRKEGVADYERYFKEAYFAGTHEDVARDVLERRAQAGALKNTVYEALVATDPGFRREVAILATSKKVPENGLAVRAAMPPGLKERIRSALLGMDRNPAGAAALQSIGAVRFIPTRDEDYAPIDDYAREAGIDLDRYEYDNR
ncbi:MAG: phosphate/phosphite/phosphonate ABC transporter substrate-binding protein [Deltaproteobacteria bacterium]|nr:phosphate/phosphite/phosphonate ABC transporter substrate-binding protein [Deltaproteobacteria bacterium]